MTWADFVTYDLVHSETSYVFWNHRLRDWIFSFIFLSASSFLAVRRSYYMEALGIYCHIRMWLLMSLLYQGSRIM